MGELLRDAAARGDSDQVVRLLAGGVKNQPDEGGRNALHLAAAGGHSDVVAALLLARWDVNAQDSAGYTAIQRAAAEGHVEVVKQLIKHGANVNIQDKVYGNTALHEACWKGYSKCVEALCQANKVNLQIKNFGGFAPLHLACQNGHNQSCRELLMANCNPDIQNNYGDTPLHTSARYGHAGVTRILISADCHTSDQNKNGDTALHITAAMGRRKLTRILLEAGCDPNRRNKQNERAKDIAIRKDLNEIIEIIDKTVPINRRDKQKEKPKTKTKGNDKKREKIESGSSKDSSSRPKEKKKHKGDHQGPYEKMIDTKWSPYGCHYYPDPKTFPKPKLDSLPHEPLKKGEQYYLDLAGNIRKGPVGVGYTCYCAPFFRHMEERLDRDKKELKDHIDAAHIRLDKKVTSLEAKTRGQLNEITRTMALERAKCQQRHLHLEQWLIRGTILRNSEKLKPSESMMNSLPKSRSLENIIEEKNPTGRFNGCRSVEMLNERNTTLLPDDDDLKNRSSSREGKESGKGSSEVVGLGTSDGEEQTRSTDEEKMESFRKGRLSIDDVDGRSLRTTREISERIDEVLRNGDGPESMELLYDEMMKWRNYHNNKSSEKDLFLRKNDTTPEGRSPFRELNQEKSFDSQRDTPRRRSYHDKEFSRPSGVEEPERKSVEEIVAKFQKQQTVQELVAKIQRKTGLIHKSAQKWKENKIKNREKDVNEKIKTELFVSKKEPETEKSLQPDYENVGYRDMPKDALSRLPYRCRDTVYSPSQDLDSFFPPGEYQRNFQKSPDGVYFSETNLSGYNPHDATRYDRNEDFERRMFSSRHDLSDSPQNRYYGMYGSHHDIKGAKVEFDDRNLIGRSVHFSHAYSPTQNDSGYSTKPYGGSSTGPSPSLSGKGV